MASLRAREEDRDLEILERLGEAGHIYWHPDMEEREVAELTRKLGFATMRDALDAVEDALLRRCVSIFKQSGGNVFASYDVDVWRSRRLGLWIVGVTKYRGDEAEEITYDACRDV